MLLLQLKKNCSKNFDVEIIDKVWICDLVKIQA